MLNRIRFESADASAALIQSTVFISMYLPMQNLFNHHILNCEFFQQRIHMKIKKEAEKIWTESVNCNLKFVNGL